MSVRRLAAESVQPPIFAFTEASRSWVDAQIAKYPAGRQASAVLPLLWKAQEQNQYWLPKAAIEHVADLLNMPYMRVLEVATFYTMFNLEPVGKYFIQLCGTTPCRLRGAEDIIKVCEERIGPQHHISGDGNFSWLEVECLGACCNAPMVQINNDYYEDLTAENFNALLDNLGAGKPVKIGPQNGRNASEPESDIRTLKEGTLFDGSSVGAWKTTFEDRKKKADEAKAAAAAAKAAEEAKAKEAADKPVEQAKEAAPGRPTPSEGKSGAMQDTPAATGTASQDKANAGQPTMPAEPKDALGVAASDPVMEAKAQAEEREIAVKLASLPKTATATEKADAVGSKPAGIAAARDGKADDLKRISGIGRVNEGKLNALGIFHFDQIAAWSRQEIRWVGTYLAFPGRITREDWIGQAKTLTEGGDTLFSKRVDRGNVPSSKA